MGKAKPARKGRAPRAVGGGRSARYTARRDARGATTQYAAAWSDAAAKAVLDALHALKQQTSEELCKVCADVLASDGAIDAFVDRQCKQLDRAGRELARGIMRVNMAKIAAAKERKGAAAAKDRIYGFLKPLRVRKREAGTVEELVVDTVGVGSKSFHAWLSPEPARDRTRDMTRNKRIMAGISKWPLGWLERPGVVCYERAAGRVRGERNGRPDAAFMRGVVKTVELPTAVENPADHYVLVEGTGQARFLTVEEVGRAFGVPDGSPLLAMLKDATVMTPVQAVASLGNGLHVGVARAIVATLLRRGVLTRGLTYGSAYSGIDMFAAAVEEETGGDWEYVTASESCERTRNALLEAWGGRGLTRERCHMDATSADAAEAPPVDLMVVTPICTPHSRRHHGRSDTEQEEALGQIWAAMEYVRKQRPKVVIVENVSEPGVVGPLTGLLSRLEGYSLATATLDPRRVAGEPMVRERQFWLMERTHV